MLRSIRHQSVYEAFREHKLYTKHTYNDPRVLIYDWVERRFQEEEMSKAIQFKESNNMMSYQKKERYIAILNNPVQLTRNRDGYLHHADIIRLKCHDGDAQTTHFLSALPYNISADDGTFDTPCRATATKEPRVTTRTSFHVFRNDNRIPNHVPLMYQECLLISTIQGTGGRLLHCEPKKVWHMSDKSHHDEVSWERDLSSRSLWRVVAIDKDRHYKRHDKSYVPTDTDIVLCNVATGKNLSLELRTRVDTVFGQEKEVAGHIYDNFRFGNAEKENVWQFGACLVNPEEYGAPMVIPSCDGLRRNVCHNCRK